MASDPGRGFMNGHEAGWLVRLRDMRAGGLAGAPVAALGLSPASALPGGKLLWGPQTLGRRAWWPVPLWKQVDSSQPPPWPTGQDHEGASF